MGSILGKSWLTTIIGLLGAILEVLLPLIQNGSVEASTLLRATLFASLGFAAKSFNVTGSLTEETKKVTETTQTEC